MQKGGKGKINGWVNCNYLSGNWDKTILYKTETIGYNFSKTNAGIIKIQTVNLQGNSSVTHLVDNHTAFFIMYIPCS